MIFMNPYEGGYSYDGGPMFLQDSAKVYCASKACKVDSANMDSMVEFALKHKIPTLCSSCLENHAFNRIQRELGGDDLKRANLKVRYYANTSNWISDAKANTLQFSISSPLPAATVSKASKSSKSLVSSE